MISKKYNTLAVILIRPQELLKVPGNWLIVPGKCGNLPHFLSLFVMFAEISAISCLFRLLFVIFRCFFAKIYVIFGIFCYFLRKSALYPGSRDPPFLQRFSLLTLSYSYGASSLLCKYVLFSSVCPFVWRNGKQYQTSVAIAAEFLPTCEPVWLQRASHRWCCQRHYPQSVQ